MAFGFIHSTPQTLTVATKVLWPPMAMFVGVSRFVRAGAAAHLHTLGKSGIAFGFCSFVGWRLVDGETHFPHPSLIDTNAGGPNSPRLGAAHRIATGPHFPVESFLLLWRLPTSAPLGPWRNPRQRNGAPAPLLRRRGAPAPSPPARP